MILPLTTAGASAANRPTCAHLAILLGEIVMAQAEAALSPMGLTPRGYHTIQCISENADLSQQELSKMLGLYAPQMVSLIDGLEARGLVERAVSRKDRRRNVMHLTAEGRSLLEISSRTVGLLEEKLFGCLAEKDRRRFQNLVEELAALPCPYGPHDEVAEA